MDRHCRYLRMIVEEMFEVWFEDCILKEPVLLEAEYLAGLNKLRKYIEVSLGPLFISFLNLVYI